MMLKLFNSFLLKERPLFNNVTIKPLLLRNISMAYGESELIDKWKLKFEEENVPEVDASLENILDHVLDREKVPKIETKKSLLLSDDQTRQFEQLCECRVARMPIQYIIREWEFRDLKLKMEPPVFIPRPETEELVELILQQFDCKRTMRFVEVGCGTGAISLAILKSLPKASAVAIDQSSMACDLTARNAKNLGFDDRLRIVKHKLTSDSKLDDIEGNLDLIVSNPPYVLRDDLRKLQPEILLYEDLRALDGGPDGLCVIKDVLLFASHKLRVKGMLWLEVDPSHPKLIEEYLMKHPDFKLNYVASYKDMFQRERFVEIKKA